MLLCSFSYQFQINLLKTWKTDLKIIQCTFIDIKILACFFFRNNNNNNNEMTNYSYHNETDDK